MGDSALEVMYSGIKELGIKGLFLGKFSLLLSRIILSHYFECCLPCTPLVYFVGTKARLLHVGVIVVIQLLTYDYVKQLCGIPVTGLH